MTRLGQPRPRRRRAAGSEPAAETAAARLSAAMRGLVRVLRARAAGPRPGDPEPAPEWERRVDERLRSVEKQLANQNRLLLVTFVTLLADAVAKVLAR